MKFPASFFEDIITTVPDGIIVMDQDRTIHYINKSASALTGWKVGENVPYCSYCQQRELEDERDRCILTADDPLPFFHSHMAAYSGIEQEFEMSLIKKEYLDEYFWVLRLLERGKEHDRENCQELLIQETMHAQELERKKIARELHDHIGQNVYSIFLGLEGIRHIINNEEYDIHFENLIKVMEKTQNDIKVLSKNLRPDMIYHLGIKDALQEAIKDWENFYDIDIKLQVELKKTDCTDIEKEVCFFRIIQEAVTNAVRHGRATSIDIHLKSSDNNIYFYINDNGEGFNIEARNKKGLGLKHMHERCKMLNGDIRWICKEGGPTRVEGVVSINKQQGDVNHETIDS